MDAPSRVIRRPQHTLVLFSGPPPTVYKFGQRDVSRIEQSANAPLEYLAREQLVAVARGLGVATLPLDEQDRADLAGAAPAVPPAAAAKPDKAAAPPPVEPPGYADLAPTAEEQAGGSSRLRIGLLVAVIVLAVVLLLAIAAFLRLLSGPEPGNQTTRTATLAASATVTGAPGAPSVLAPSNVSVHSGPAEQYPVIGLLPAGGAGQVVGRTSAGDWWLVQAVNIQGGQGWVPADAVIASNVEDVPLATPPPLPTATPTIPASFPDWKGEYFANPDIDGQPVLARNDPDINFNWGAGSPAPGVPPNDYSVRWTRQAFLEQGNTVFAASVEGGVRLWLDGRLLIDSWRSQGLRLEQAESGALAQGQHDLRVEYRKLTGNGQIAVSWQLQPSQPPVAVIDGPAQALVGEPARFSGKNSLPTPGSRIVDYQWLFGDGTGASGPEVSKTYQAAGVYELKLTVVDLNGLTASASQLVQIAAPTPTPSQPPTASIVAPTQATVGQAVTFDGSNSRGATPLVSYQWNFGDGSTAGDVRVDHVYSSAGVFDVTLTVVDSTGLRSTAGARIQIDDVPTPTPIPELPLIGVEWRLVAYNSGQPALTPILPGSQITARFDQDGALLGFAGCNTYNAQYQVDGAALSIGLPAAGQAACATPEGVMQQEAAYLALLPLAASYRWNEGRQELLAATGSVLLQYAPGPTPR